MAMKKRKQKGQAIMEYVIIIVIVALAALVVIGAFSDRVRTLFAGAANSLGAEDVTIGKGSAQTLKDMDESGIELDQE
jgi:Flp pilus assembly pilin Flp